jgi:hypothetical protein
MKISIDFSQVEAAMRGLPGLVVVPAARMALNDAAKQGHTAAKAKIREKFNLTAKFINERVKISSLASDWDLSVSIEATGRPIDLTHFGARWVRGNRVVSRAGTSRLRKKKSGVFAEAWNSGVYFEARKGQPGYLPHAFIATVKAGKSGGTHMGVFVRSGRERLPIIKKSLISVPSMFEQRQVFEAVRQVVEAKFAERFQHHVDRATDKFAGPS